VWIRQPGNQVPGAHPDALQPTDAAGNLSWTLSTDGSRVPLEVGTVQLDLKPSDSAPQGSPTARCDFEVVP